MIKNYLITALNSMLRRKYFTILTLLSIALSLVVITCGASLWNMISAPIAPEVYKDRTFFLGATTQLKKDGKEIHYMNAGAVLTPEFFFKKVYQLETPEKITVFDRRGGLVFNKTAMEKYFSTMQTDHNFFSVFDFELLSGKVYTENDNQAVIPLCVISNEFATYHFDTNDCVGSILKYRNKRYKVSGVFKKPASSSMTIADLYFLTNPQKESKYWNWREVAFLCKNEKDKTALDAELKHIGLISSEKHENQEVDLFSYSSIDKHLSTYVDKSDYPLIFALLFVILALPILCLVDILRNFLDMKKEELGVRRAFGARKNNVVLQLMLQNLVVTSLGGICGLLFSFAFFFLMGENDAKSLLTVFFHWKSFIYYLLVFATIGIIAGIIPSYRLSKQPIVSSLNNSEL